MLKILLHDTHNQHAQDCGLWTAHHYARDLMYPGPLVSEPKTTKPNKVQLSLMYCPQSVHQCTLEYNNKLSIRCAPMYS